MGDFAVEVGRIVDQFRSMPVTRLASPYGDHSSRAAAGRALAQRLADLTAEWAGEQRRVVPDVGDAAVGDQIAVIAADLVRAGVSDAVLAAAGDDVRAVRLSL